MFESHPFGAGIDVSGFDSGEPDLDEWLRRHAVHAYARGTARTFVLMDEDVPVGYYALTAHKVARADMPPVVARGATMEIPAVLLAKLALDRRYQGRGNGSVLLWDACTRVVAATRIVAARVLVVDAVHEKAVAFYEHHGFHRLPETMRLYRKVSDISRDVGE